MEILFVPVAKKYEMLAVSVSETEIEKRRNSREYIDKLLSEDFHLKCSVGDGLRKTFPSHKKNHSKAYSHMKITDEAKIDLGLVDPHSTLPSIQSACKIYPIEEVSEHSSPSSKMCLLQYQKMQQVQRIIDENKISSKTRPKGRSSQNSTSAVKIEREIEIFKPFYHRSEESIVESAFADHLGFSPERNDRYEQMNSPFGSLASFKRAQFHRLSNDVVQYQTQKSKPKNYGDNCHELETIRSGSSHSLKSSSCFGCLIKPISNLCRKKSSKL